jgi:methylmalonyl-CoA/ethylmalonyl-CoA epimerase
MMFPKSANSIDHIAIAVYSIQDSASHFERLSGHTCSPIETIESQGVRAAFVGSVELLEPLSPDSVIGRFLERKGQGLHHIAYRTDDIYTELSKLTAEDFELIDEEPRRGANGHLVAFLHPRSTGGILTELVQHSE